MILNKLFLTILCFGSLSLTAFAHDTGFEAQPPQDTTKLLNDLGRYQAQSLVRSPVFEVLTKDQQEIVIKALIKELSEKKPTALITEEERVAIDHYLGFTKQAIHKDQIESEFPKAAEILRTLGKEYIPLKEGTFLKVITKGNPHAETELKHSIVITNVLTGEEILNIKDPVSVPNENVPEAILAVAYYLGSPSQGTAYILNTKPKSLQDPILVKVDLTIFAN